MSFDTSFKETNIFQKAMRHKKDYIHEAEQKRKETATIIFTRQESIKNRQSTEY